MKWSPRRVLLALAAVLGTGGGLVHAQCPAADVHEEDDDCASALVLTPGTYTDLTLYGNGHSGGEDADFFRVSVPSGEILTVDCLHDVSSGDIDVYFFDAASPACGGHSSGNYLVRGFTGSDDENVSWNNTTGATLDLIVEIDAWDSDSDFDCNDYELVITVAPDPCVTVVDDSFEDNDDCASAAVLAPGVHQGLFVSADEDYYRIPLAATEQLALGIQYNDSIAGLRMELYDDAACSNLIESGGWNGSDTLTATNTTGAALDVYARVYVQSGDCNNYDLDLFVQPDPCQQTGADDALEDNDDCAAATPVDPQGDAYTALFVSTADPDLFAITLNPEATLTVSCVHQSALADLDIYLYDETAVTLGLCGDPNTGAIEDSTGSGDLETVSYTHMGAAPATFYLLVDVWSGGSGADCGTYDLEFEVEGGESAVPFCFGDGSGFGGATICPCSNHPTPGVEEGCKNSMGHGALLSATGSNVVANDDLVITMAQGPPNEPSVLVQGGSLISVPFKDGILCVSAPVQMLEFVTLDASGAGSVTVPVGGAGGALPGDTLYYQQWYRDPGGVSPCGQGSNFSHGLEVRWF